MEWLPADTQTHVLDFFVVPCFLVRNVLKSGIKSIMFDMKIQFSDNGRKYMYVAHHMSKKN